MKISCQSCQSKYNVADEKVQGKVVKIRCRKCGATIVVDGNAPQTANGSVVPSPAAAAAEAGGDGQWHVNVSETDQRSMSLAELVDAYNSSVVTQETFIWTDGMDDWKPLGEVDTVVAALHAAAAGGQAQQAYAQEPAPPEREDAPTAAFSYDQAAAAGYDLPFDASHAHGAGAQAAQAAAAPVAEPRRAAVVKPRGRDLFGEGGGAADEVQTSAPSMAHAQSMARSPAAADPSSSMTGERNENSVLFSLAALTKNSGPADVPPPPVGSKDDSGLIDLKALAMKTQSSRPVAPKADADLFSAPLGFTPAPLGAPLGALGSSVEAEPKSKLPLLIGGGVGVLVLMVLSVVLTLKFAGGPAPAPSASVAAPVPSATAPEPPPSATAEPSATAAPSASVAAAPKPKAAGGGGGGGVAHPVGGGGAAKPPAAGAAAPAGTGAAPAQTAAPKKASGCEAACAGDLMCLMKCSTH